MKKLKCLVLILILLITPSAFASTNVVDRNTLDNYGVNKHWRITSKNKNNVLSTYKVDASEKIYDFSNILTEEEETRVYEKMKEFITKTHMDMVFVTANFSYSSDHVNEDFAADFYDYNDFGLDYENYSGVLLLRNTYESDPYFDVYMFGDAQLYFDSYRSNAMLDAIYDDFHNGRYESGLNTFISMYSSYYDQGIPNSMKDYKVNKDGYLYKEYSIPWGIIIVIDSVVTLITIIVLVNKNKLVTKKLNIDDYFNQKNVNYTKANNIFVNERVTSYTTSSSSGGGSSFGGSSSGSSGGGHSSGGGRHG